VSAPARSTHARAWHQHVLPPVVDLGRDARWGRFDIMVGTSSVQLTTVGLTVSAR
jgi:hypothetical protein